MEGSSAEMPTPEAAAQRVLSTRHAKLLLERSSADPSLLPDLACDIRRRSGGAGWGRRWTSLACKAILLCSLAHAVAALLFSRYPGLWQQLQNTEAFSRAELEYNRLLRRATVGLGLHDWELLHAREREQCLVPNPLYRPPLRCCPCDKLRVVSAGSAARLRSGFDALFDRMVAPFAYGNSSQPPVTFPELRAAVAASWEAVSRGSNRLRVLWPPGDDAPPSLEGLLRSSEPPAGRAVAWLFGHLPAVRALRRLVRRPDHVPDLAEEVPARQFVFLGAGVPPDERIGLGDLGIVRGLAYAFALHGEALVSLALKPECCPAEAADPGHPREQTRRLGPGQVLGFLTDCYWVSVARPQPAPGYAVVYIGSVYNGIHPTEARKARRPAA